MIESAVAAADEDQPIGVQIGRHPECELGVGEVLVGIVARDRRVPLGPGESVGRHRVEVADESGRQQPGGQCVVEGAVGGEHDAFARQLGDERVVERSGPGHHDDRLVHSTSSAGITRIRFSGRWRRPPSQPAASRAPRLVLGILPADAVGDPTGPGRSIVVS